MLVEVTIIYLYPHIAVKKPIKYDSHQPTGVWQPLLKHICSLDRFQAANTPLPWVPLTHADPLGKVRHKDLRKTYQLGRSRQLRTERAAK